MCGIAGILRFDGKSSDEALLHSMNNAMAHRGPDAAGIYNDGSIGLCHRRLSILDLSTSANQPFADVSDRYITVFNGEIYNFQEVKKQLSDYPFKTTGDTEVLVAAYKKWGRTCIDYLKGMFAFAIWDKEKKELILARDRVGVKPLYYYIDTNKLIFASELRTILATNLVPRKANPKAIYEFLSYQSVSSPLSMIEGIQQLKAGSWMTIDTTQNVESKVYWNFPTSQNDNYASLENVKSEIHALLGKAITSRLISDVPVGAFLSGGIDSSIVVGLMATVGGIRPDTFNVSFTEKEYDESIYADMIVKKFNTRHTQIQLSPKSMLDNLENALNALDTPSGDGINSYIVSKAIRDAGISVALSGIGGDELFAGYPIFQQFAKIHKQKKWWSAAGFLRRLASLPYENTLTNKKSRVAQILRIPSPDIEYVYPILRQLTTPALMKTTTHLSITDSALFTTLKNNSDWLHSLPVLSQVSVADLMGYTQNTLLKDTDQMSMAVALEVREPFFDTDLIEYVLGIPDKIKEPVYAKSLLVESVKPLLPDEVVFRKKQGFVFPWKSWLKNDLKPFCQTQIDKLGNRSFIRKEQLVQFWNRFLAGDDTIRWMDVWLFVVLEYWLQKNDIEV